MYFLIDYENVQNSGMLGTDVLTREDCLDLFYAPPYPRCTASIWRRSRPPAANSRYTS